jgi:hypothetical protein
VKVEPDAKFTVGAETKTVVIALVSLHKLTIDSVPRLELLLLLELDRVIIVLFVVVLL